MIPRRVWQAILIAFVCHGLFILTGRYRLSYDAYTHMLFANHYAENWFSLWEQRWYTGFTVVSYPPLTHQLIALFIPVLGFDKAFALILWIVTALYPLGVYSFSCIFTGKTPSAYAALVSAVLLPIYVTAYIFGQFPFLVSTLFALFSAAALNQYLRKGGIHNLFLTISLYATTMALHHATLIVQPFLILAVILNYVFESPRSFPWRQLIRRILFVCSLATLAGLLVIWPFWEWGTHQTMQTPIDHLSRHNFFNDPLAFGIFFFPLYGPLVVIIPLLLRKWPPRLAGLIFSFTVLFLFGLGGTTPLPRLFFGANWEWLTYDRFAFWACLTLTPFFGILFIRLKYGWKNRITPQPRPASLRKRMISFAVFSIFAITALGSWFQPVVYPTQPKPIDMRPIVEFLNQNDYSQWRYLTFGFGNQFTYLNLLTTATTIDGSYNTVRTLPELRESGIAEVDTSYWTIKGIPAIRTILEKSGVQGVRWGFVNRMDFIPELKKDGWIYRETLSNGIQVWENPSAVLPKPSRPPKTSSITAFSWGVLPILSLITTLSLGGLRVFPIQTKRIIDAIYALAVSLIPLSLCFWIFQPVANFPNPRVYFIYTNALFFFSDAFIVFSVLLWTAYRTQQLSMHGFQHLNSSLKKSPFGYRPTQVFILLILSLFILISFSLLWSENPQTSLYISIHFWFLFLLILCLRDWHEAWKYVLFGLCTALSIEIITGFIEFGIQSTAFLGGFKMEWPGALEPTVHGASVVQLANGLRILRAYGTLPHPNILGGLTLFALVAPGSLYLEKRNRPALILLSLGIILLVLTFSRSAWLGFIAFLAILVMKSKYFDHGRIILFISVCAVSITLALYPLHALLFTRISNSSSATEKLSMFGREWLTEQALTMLQQHPMTGVGIGSFIINLSNYAVAGAIIEPAHNIFLLAGAELGIFGLLLLISIFICIGFAIYKAHTPKAILSSATLTGLGIISLFDHYLWTLAPGRVMLALVLGIWLGQLDHDA